MLTSVHCGRRQKGIIDVLVFEETLQSHHVRGGRQLHQFPPPETPPAFRAALPLLDGSPAADARSAAGTAAAAASGVHDVQPDFTAAARGGGIVHGMVSASVRRDSAQSSLQSCDCICLFFPVSPFSI